MTGCLPTYIILYTYSLYTYTYKERRLFKINCIHRIIILMSSKILLQIIKNHLNALAQDIVPDKLISK